MSGVKTTLSALSYAQNHISNAERVAQTVPSLHNQIQLRLIELIRDLNVLVSTMQAGDPNIATVQAQITALS